MSLHLTKALIGGCEMRADDVEIGMLIRIVHHRDLAHLSGMICKVLRRVGNTHLFALCTLDKTSLEPIEQGDPDRLGLWDWHCSPHWMEPYDTGIFHRTHTNHKHESPSREC